MVAFLSRKVEYVLNAAFALRGLTSGALLGALFLVVLWKRGRALPVMIGMVGSFLAMIFISRYEWEVSQAPTLQTARIAWPWYTLIGTILCVGIAWIVRAIMGKSVPSK